MSLLNLVTDGYERKARLYPGLVLVAPLAVSGFAFVSGDMSAIKSLVTVVVACGGAFLLGQLARDAGKRREKSLFEEWGGLPSVAIFRHRDNRVDSITKLRYHKTLSNVVKGTTAPTIEDEREDPAAADLVYTAWSTFVRLNTRDTKKYPLLFQENVNYGYRRNIFGLRPVGIIACILCCAIDGARCWQLFSETRQVGEAVAGAFAFSFMLLMLWVFQFSSAWVRVPADAYAERLAEATDTLGLKKAAVKK